MDIAAALQRAGQFAAKDGAAAFLRVYPSYFDERRPVEWAGNVPLPHFSAKVCATDGEVAVAIDLDPQADVPTMAPRAQQLGKALQVAKKDTFTLIRTGVTTCGVQLGTGGAMVVPGMDPEEHPFHLAHPPALSAIDPEVVAVLSSMLHVPLTSDEDRSVLECLHLTPGWVEATDQTRVIRAAVALVREPILVPSRVFRKIAKDEPVSYAVAPGSPSLFFLRIGDELRWVRTRPAAGFFDLSPLFQHYQSHGLVQVDPAWRAVKAAAAVSDIKLVELQFGDQRLGVRGRNANGSVVSVADLPAFGCHAPGRMVLDADLLLEGLKARRGESAVAVSYDGEASPLQLRQGRVAELIWPKGA